MKDGIGGMEWEGWRWYGYCIWMVGRPQNRTAVALNRLRLQEWPDATEWTTKAVSPSGVCHCCRCLWADLVMFQRLDRNVQHLYSLYSTDNHVTVLICMHACRVRIVSISASPFSTSVSLCKVTTEYSYYFLQRRHTTALREQELRSRVSVFDIWSPTHRSVAERTETANGDEGGRRHEVWGI